MGVSSLGKDHTWEINLAARAAWMSYVGELTQSEIAKRLGVSSARVHRLIQLAKQHGIIRISIEGRPAECMHLEAEIAAQFKLKSCTISPYLADCKDKTDLSTLAVGQAAGQVLAQHIILSQTRSVTIDPFGSILVEAIRAMPQFSRPELQVWASSGCLSSGYHSTNSEVLSLLEMRTGARIGLIPAPYAPGSEAEWASFSALPAIINVLHAAAKSTIFVSEIKPAQARDETTDAAYAQSVQASDAVCRFLGACLDTDGKRLKAPAVPKTICVSLDDLEPERRAGDTRVFALAAQEMMMQPVLAALRSGLVTDLLLDEALAATLTRT